MEQVTEQAIRVPRDLLRHRVAVVTGGLTRHRTRHITGEVLNFNGGAVLCG